ncbi:reverse transcriptase domain, reverse transcriptase zinc-binding domain protein, partial [Tanacetum coccineum]
YRAGLSSSSTVRDVICNGSWTWPLYLINKYPLLHTIPMPNMDATVPDCLEWHNELGLAKPFCVSSVWSTIRPRNDKVNWFAVVWFASCIPRHAFNLWLVVKQKLKTQDIVTWWDVLGSLPSVFPLCELVPDSHDHFIFECSFSQQVWNQIKLYARMNTLPPIFSQIMAYVSPFASRKSSKSVVTKLVIAATAYFIWQERN